MKKKGGGSVPHPSGRPLQSSLPRDGARDQDTQIPLPRQVQPLPIEPRARTSHDELLTRASGSVSFVFSLTWACIGRPVPLEWALGLSARSLCARHVQVLAAAVHAASEAGAHMKAKVGANVLKTKFNTKDLLTEVDPECQRIIEEVMSQHFPDHALLGEEAVEPGSEASSLALQQALSDGAEGDVGARDWLWIVDPIDGTTNFVHGMPLSAVSIGIAYRGRVVVGEPVPELESKASGVR